MGQSHTKVPFKTQKYHLHNFFYKIINCLLNLWKQTPKHLDRSFSHNAECSHAVMKLFMWTAPEKKLHEVRKRDEALHWLHDIADPLTNLPFLTFNLHQNTESLKEAAMAGAWKSRAARGWKSACTWGRLQARGICSVGRYARAALPQAKLKASRLSYNRYAIEQVAVYCIRWGGFCYPRSMPLSCINRFWNFSLTSCELTGVNRV